MLRLKSSIILLQILFLICLPLHIHAQILPDELTSQLNRFKKNSQAFCTQNLLRDTRKIINKLDGRQLVPKGYRELNMSYVLQDFCRLVDKLNRARKTKAPEQASIISTFSCDRNNMTPYWEKLKKMRFEGGFDYEQNYGEAIGQNARKFDFRLILVYNDLWMTTCQIKENNYKL
jgi:hypothetical protein